MNQEIIKYLREELEAREYIGDEGAGVLPFARDTKRFLVGLRSEDVNEPHTWGIFGGKMDNINHSPESVAKRELKEETGYNGSIELIKGYIFKDSNFKYTNFIGVVPIEFKPKINWEHDSVSWMNYEELLRLGNKHFGLSAFIKNSKEIFDNILN